MAQLPEDIVAEILLSLPMKPLFKLKCLSKGYESIISNPQFGKRYLQRAWSSPKASASLGLLASLLYPFNLDPLSKNVKDLSEAINCSAECPHSDQLSISVCSVSLPSDDGDKIVASSNGLILSVFHPLSLYVATGGRLSSFMLRLSNPLTKQSVVIPESTLNDYLEVGFGIGTRHATYKIVLIRRFVKKVRLEDNASTSVEIFCSVSGSWATWEVTCCPGEVFDLSTVNGGFSYNGVLHWLCHKMGAVITYDPYDSPDRFSRIPLPKKRYLKSGYKSLIWSGDEGILKYCEMGKSKSGVDRLWVWRLCSGIWCLEGKFLFPSLDHGCKRLMLALNPCNPHVLCRPYVIDNKVAVLNPRNGERKFVDVLVNATAPPPTGASTFLEPLIPIKLCPWSSPFYAQPQST